MSIISIEIMKTTDERERCDTRCRVSHSCCEHGGTVAPHCQGAPQNLMGGGGA